MTNKLYTNFSASFLPNKRIFLLYKHKKIQLKHNIYQNTLI